MNVSTRTLSTTPKIYNFRQKTNDKLLLDTTSPQSHLSNVVNASHHQQQQEQQLSICLLTSPYLPDLKCVSQKTSKQRKNRTKPPLESFRPQKPNGPQVGSPQAIQSNRIISNVPSDLLKVEKANLIGSASKDKNTLKISTEMSSKYEHNKSASIEPMTRYRQDAEYEAYLDEKKSLSDKIHEHWNKDLSAHKLAKGAPINKVNDRIYKSNQWITINNNNNNNSTKTSTSSNLVDTFTTTSTDLDYPLSSRGVRKYQVNGHVGVLIAEKLQSGERLRVCRNGEEIAYPSGEESDLFSDINKGTGSEKESKSILSWKDQVKKENVKIIEPTINPEKETQPLEERTLIVKKLIDEPEFQPEKRKKPLVIDLMKHISTNTLEVVGSSTLPPPPNRNQAQQQRIAAAAMVRIPPVEIIRLRPTTALGRSLYNQSPIHTTTPYDNYVDDDDADENESVVRIEKPRLVARHRQKPPAGSRLDAQLGEALDDNLNYSRVMDTLADRLATNAAKLVKVNRNGDKAVKSMQKKVIGLMRKEDESDAFSTSSLSSSFTNRNRASIPSRPQTASLKIESYRFQQQQHQQKKPPTSQQTQIATARSNKDLKSLGGGYYVMNNNKAATNLSNSRRAKSSSGRQSYYEQSFYVNLARHLEPMKRLHTLEPYELYSSETNSREILLTNRNNHRLPSTPQTGSR